MITCRSEAFVFALIATTVNCRTEFVHIAVTMTAKRSWPPRSKLVSPDSIESKVVTIISEQLSLREEDIKVDSRFVDDLGADSLDIVELIMEMEEEFDIEIPDEDIEKIVTVQDVIGYITRHVMAE